MTGQREIRVCVPYTYNAPSVPVLQWIERGRLDTVLVQKASHFRHSGLRVKRRSVMLVYALLASLLRLSSAFGR